MRICILSDTHGTLDTRILAAAAECDMVVHAGDIGDAGVLDALHGVCDQVIAVLGNNDLPGKWRGDQHALLATLPWQAHIELPGGILAIEHGHRVNPVATRHTRLRARHPQARAIVYGHSHQLLLDQSAEPWVLNPGAAGRARTKGGPSCLLLDAGSTTWQLSARRFVPQ